MVMVIGSTTGSMLPEYLSAQAAGLYEAAITGNVEALNALPEGQAQVILQRVSVLRSFAETPLHLAALMGHLDFSKRLLMLRPQLTSEQDSEKCTPLHLAAASDHVPVVKELLRANEKACLIQDQEGRTPLHLAAMRGRVRVAKELVKSVHGAESIEIMVDDGDNVLHLCVKYNHLDVLKVVLGSILNKDEVLMMTDSHGYTVLHLAVMLKQIKTVRFSLESSKEWPKMFKSNKMDLLDVLKHSPNDLKMQRIGEILADAGFSGVLTERTPVHEIRALQAPKTDGHGSKAQPSVGGFLGPWEGKILEHFMNYNGDWMNDTRGSLMMVASIISTVTFTAAIAPPGGVWQEDNTTSKHCTASEVCYAGTAVFAYREKYREFLMCDMISFAASVIVMFLLISGVPLNNKVGLWVLSVFLSITIAYLGFTFMKGAFLLIPERLIEGSFYNLRFAIYTISVVIIVFVGICLAIRLCFWFKENRQKFTAIWNWLIELRSTMPKLVADSYARWKTVPRANTGRNLC